MSNYTSSAAQAWGRNSDRFLSQHCHVEDNGLDSQHTSRFMHCFMHCMVLCLAALRGNDIPAIAITLQLGKRKKEWALWQMDVLKLTHLACDAP